MHPGRATPVLIHKFEQLRVWEEASLGIEGLKSPFENTLMFHVCAHCSLYFVNDTIGLAFAHQDGRFRLL